jgi:hypothetical protein
MFDHNMRYLQVSDLRFSDYGADNSKVLGRSQYELFSGISNRWKEMHRRGLNGETLRVDEDRWDREDGTNWIRWGIRRWWNLGELPGGLAMLAIELEQIKNRARGRSGPRSKRATRNKTDISCTA